MKIIELEVNNIRGIQHINIHPSGKNYLIFGPNGTGKSAVVDALDFLLTGRISRFKGEGTGEIHLSKHGVHILHKPEEASVKAKIRINGINNDIVLRRCIANPTILEYDQQYHDELSIIIEQSEKGQHILTRKELLKYITSKPRTRAEEIQILLNADEVEDIRKCLIKVRNSIKEEVRKAEKVLEEEKIELSAIIQQKEFKDEVILNFINQMRNRLKATPLSQTKSGELKVGVIPPEISNEPTKMGKSLISNYINNLVDIDSPNNIAELTRTERKLREDCEEIRSNPDLLKILQKYDLAILGVKLIDESGSCPLCDTPFPPGELVSVLQDRIEFSRRGKEKIDEINILSKNFISSVKLVETSLKQSIKILNDLKISEGNEAFKLWDKKLNNFNDALETPIEKFLGLPYEQNEIVRLCAPNNLVNIINNIKSKINEIVLEISPEQQAWDILTSLEFNLKRYEKANRQLEDVKISYNRSELLYDSFLEARDEILGKLYNLVNDRFTYLYKKMHEDEQKSFSSSIRPDGPGLKFEVDFYNYGQYPPHALHSEGHQDSMGLCLFLSLFEQLNKGIIDLVVLDDIVMSIDADHRKSICKILANDFPDEQFFITTHDRAWKNQLMYEGVVTQENILEFHNWSVSDGPQFNEYLSNWSEIDRSIANNDVPGAAARLRRDLEEFFTIICERINAKVPLKSNRQWEFGEVVQGAMSKYKLLVKNGLKAAQSWDNSELIREFIIIEEYRNRVYKLTNVEQWAINPNVHYNNWMNYTKNDFIPVVDAFQRLTNLFICDECGSMIFVVKEGMKDVNLRCLCSNFNWNLITKSE